VIRRDPTERLPAYATLGGIGLVAAFAFQRPELLAVVVPFLLVVVVGSSVARAPRLAVEAELERHRTVEDEDLGLRVSIACPTTLEEVDVLAVVPRGLDVRDGVRVTGLALAGQPRLLTIALRCRRWGGYEIGPIVTRTYDPMRLFTYEQTFDVREPLRVFPDAERLRALVAPRETQVFAGNRVARARGEGIEFAELRPYVAGEAVRRVNWRATARRGTPWVTQHHPERNSDVVLFLDTFAHARGEHGSTLDETVRAAVSLATAYLEQRDRVGVVSFGGLLRWLRPAGGHVQRYRIIDALLDTELVLSYAWKGIDVVPHRALPPQSLVVALSPLLDERSRTALVDLRRRRFDVAVVDVSPVPAVGPGRAWHEDLAYRLWLLRREQQRGQLAALGVPVVEWRPPDPLQRTLAGLEAWRRRGRRASA
jgi:uncharacterized protein (DUF58 family)